MLCHNTVTTRSARHMGLKGRLANNSVWLCRLTAARTRHWRHALKPHSASRTSCLNCLTAAPKGPLTLSYPSSLDPEGTPCRFMSAKCQEAFRAYLTDTPFPHAVPVTRRHAPFSSWARLRRLELVAPRRPSSVDDPASTCRQPPELVQPLV